jgi:ankyrin repeat protein
MLLKDMSGNTVIHYAAEGGSVQDLPKEFQSIEYLKLKNSNCATPIHYAAKAGLLDRLPTSVLTKENLELRDLDSKTAYHWAAVGNNFQNIPEYLWTEGNLKDTDNRGNTPIGYIISSTATLEHKREFKRLLQKIGTEYLQTLRYDWVTPELMNAVLSELSKRNIRKRLEENVSDLEI